MVQMGADSCCSMAICDMDWFKAENPDTPISHTKDPITVCGIEGKMHPSSAYVNSSIFLEGKADDHPAMIKVQATSTWSRNWAFLC